MSEQSAEHVSLWPGKPPGSEVEDDFQPRLDIYLADTTAPCGAVVVLPGGGYTHRALHEGEPVARTFNERGMHAFVVQYRVAPHPPSAAFLDAARGMRLVRSRAAEWGVKPDHIAACGFSAGGHLTGLLGVHFDAGDSGASDPVARVSDRPDALVLCYAWLSAKHLKPEEDALFSEKWGQDTPNWVSVERHVSPETPPAFLWHTFEDTRVIAEHSLLMAGALYEKGVPFELHVYEKGHHGLGLAKDGPAKDDPHVATWADLCAQWLEGMGWV
jgi:acetyl esterase/lipase